MRTLVKVPEISRTEAAERHVRALMHRAESLRNQADSLPEPLGAAYRRRAAELDLEAFAYGSRQGVTDALAGLLAA